MSELLLGVVLGVCIGLYFGWAIGVRGCDCCDWWDEDLAE